MANFFPRSTGLPMTVWVGPRGGARHDARVKVCAAHGERANLDGAAVVGIRPEPHVVEGWLSAEDERLVARWITLNLAALLEHWDGLTDGAELARSLRRLEP